MPVLPRTRNNLHSDISVSVNRGQRLNTSVRPLSARILCKMTLLSSAWWRYVTRDGSRTLSPHLTVRRAKRCFCFLTRKMFSKPWGDNKCAAELRKIALIHDKSPLSYLGRNQYPLFSSQVRTKVQVEFLVLVDTDCATEKSNLLSITQGNYGTFYLALLLVAVVCFHKRTPCAEIYA